ncbi:L-lactate dehydrogenase complex protein LldG [Streptomyces sp. SAI-208]|uniref:LutC/YkgG family protein n=1 Tax=unclassified Streptomyces TaxID=2593676 RepID=UPI0024745886|nr:MULTISPECIES: LUD domain-containing protein [unclassified Streptomyces]MDH6589096.1 L-lactate dehydrogenase complex protein LldG [Streptomyces sp. SAI-133]MDH6605549.1 L-lactate dehydrogenase complex protein LldG [Streptomyces sp. SAI-208]
MSSRERILGRVRRALADAPGEDVPVERGYLREHGDRSVEETVELLAENLADYRAIVHRCTAADLPATLAGMLAARGAKTVLVPPGLEPAWLADAGTEQVPDRAGSTPHELDRVDSVVTACAVAVAETGTLVLDGGPDQGRRRITLVPDHHICVVRVPDQVVSSVPQALERLDPVRPLTWISGPSATSDIELDRVEGVHGPRTLEVVLVDSQPSDDVNS